MNANKISPLRELDGMYSLSLKNPVIVPLHKKFPDTLHKVKSFNCNYSVKNKTRKNSSIKPFIYSPSMLLKKPSVKVSIPIEYSDGIYKVSSILRASKPMSEAKNDGRVSQIKSVSISSNKKNDLKFNMTVNSLKNSDLPYLKIYPHKISPLKEDFFKECTSDEILINKTYGNVECNPQFSSVSKSPIYNSGEVALWNKSENSSTVEFPMEWDNLDWGIDDYYQDITDYKKYYSKIYSKEQRDNYYDDYTAELEEYQKLHARILNIKRPFEDLRLCLSTCQRETEEYKEIYNRLEEKYKAYEKDHNYIYTRLRSNHLYKKLSYIKKLIKEFDEMKLWEKNNKEINNWKKVKCTSN
ncbi:hypothetical protein TNIN_377851 [Trichonephila inaurata madagascariensis]|uniref:OCEL domain-containing protein n=1 Tax=Trichonephila inaurata madagascariensis TaxID=2747483 RepID=A0A8X6XTX6_9ARAC|nr:hypothetical protein TNIN_377851 [Trichonephila inaurata madagascariensis]